jgi:hypothetical protein
LRQLLTLRKVSSCEYAGTSEQRRILNRERATVALRDATQVFVYYSFVLLKINYSTQVGLVLEGGWLPTV